MFRTVLYPGVPFRDFTILTQQAGTLDAVALACPDGTQLAQDAAVGSLWWRGCDRMVRVPAGGLPGVYAVLADGRVAGTVTVPPVNQRPVPKTASFTVRPDLAKPGVIEQVIESWSAIGVVTFAPGLYTFARQINVPPWSEWHCEGACFYGRPDVQPYRPGADVTLAAMFVGGQNATIRGGTFHPAGLLFHSAPNKTPGLVLDRVRVVGGNLAWGYSECVFNACDFDGCACDGAPEGLWLACRHHGYFPGGASGWEAWRADASGDGNYLVYDATFDGTARGPGFTTRFGPIAGSRVHNLRVLHVIPTATNGGEWLYTEAGGGSAAFSNFLWTAIEAHGCGGDGPCIGSTPVNNGRIVMVRNDGPGAIRVAGNAGVVIDGLSVEQFEAARPAVGAVLLGGPDGGYRYDAGNIRNVRFIGGSFIRRPPSRQNQAYDPKLYDPALEASLWGPEATAAHDADLANCTQQNVLWCGWPAGSEPWGKMGCVGGGARVVATTEEAVAQRPGSGAGSPAGASSRP